mmetsp:Transcript_2108/g.2950  ORF Transcript_2108/g.2950 Transcript_2108/m.2950 type:complete len:254 (+) Transcript_2108:1059-1820(+)
MANNAGASPKPRREATAAPTAATTIGVSVEDPEPFVFDEERDVFSSANNTPETGASKPALTPAANPAANIDCDAPENTRAQALPISTLGPSGPKEFPVPRLSAAAATLASVATRNPLLFCLFSLVKFDFRADILVAMLNTDVDSIAPIIGTNTRGVNGRVSDNPAILSDEELLPKTEMLSSEIWNKSCSSRTEVENAMTVTPVRIPTIAPIQSSPDSTFARASPPPSPSSELSNQSIRSFLSGGQTPVFRGKS